MKPNASRAPAEPSAKSGPEKLREAWVIGLNGSPSGHPSGPTFHGGDRSGPEEGTSLTLVQRNRRFRDRPGHREITFAVFGAGRLHLWAEKLRH